VKQMMKWVNRMVTSILLILLVSIAGIVLSTKLTNGEPQIFGYQIKTVLSGSMEPTILTGSVIAVKSLDEAERSKLKSGDIITYLDEERLITHRITNVLATDQAVRYETKGDNNNSADSNPVLAENVIAKYEGFMIPYLGYLINFTQTANGSVLFMILPGVLMLGYSIVTIWKTIRELEKKQMAVK